MGVFKSYDIRGVYGKEWDAATAHGIGLRLPALLGARRMAVGRDVRLSSEEIFESLTRGITEAGCDVEDIGLCDTPAVYFATAFYGMDGSVMITASHNPPEYNGMKVSRREAVPVGFDTGLAQLEGSLRDADPPRADHPGVVRPLDIRGDYLSHLAKFRTRAARGFASSSTAPMEWRGSSCTTSLHRHGGDFRFIFDEPDGRFPNHAPNPLEEKNLAALKKRGCPAGRLPGNLFRRGRRPRHVRR